MVEVLLNLIGREEIYRFESIFLFVMFFRFEVIEFIKDLVERFIWVDSLVVVVGVIVREKVGMIVSEIVEEFGRMEQIIRKYFKGEIKVGQFVREIYEFIKQGKFDEFVKNVEVLVKGGQFVVMEEYEKFKKEKEEFEVKVREFEERVKIFEEENYQFKVKFENVRKVLNDVLERVKEIEKLF